MSGSGRGTAVAVALVIVVAVLAGAAIVFALLKPVEPAPMPTPTPEPTASASPTPPPDAGVPVDQSGSDPTDPQAPVVPFIVRTEFSADASSLTVYAFVPGVAEDGGTCTAIVSTPDGDQVGTSAGRIGATQTDCDPITVQLAQPASGAVTVLVRYESSVASGDSERLEVAP